MIKAEKIILIIAGLSLIFYLASMFFPSPKTGSTLEILMLIPILSIIVGAVILVKHRSDATIAPSLRVIGFVIFLLWLLSFFVDNPFRR